MTLGRCSSLPIALTAAALLCASPVPACTAPLPHRDRQVAYTVIDQDLRDVLIEVGRQSGLPVEVSAAVHGRVHGRLPAAPLAQFLDHLASIYGFDWYFDGGTLDVSAAGESRAKMLALGPVPFAQLTSTLSTLGIADPRWPLRGSDTVGVVVADGPPRYLQLVEQALTVLSQRGAIPVHIFRGSSASAPR